MNITTNNDDSYLAPPCHEEIRILFQDEYILVLDKPSGLLSLAGINSRNIDSVYHRLINGLLKGPDKEVSSQMFPSARLVHRLDIGTSGVLLIALSKEVNGILTKQFQERTVKKTYTAILEGQLAEDHGIIDFPIAKDSSIFPLVKICNDTGKTARSEYQVLERLENPSRCRVLFTPLTGRTHQLRIHSLNIGHPILGCDLYKSETSETKSERLLLHANELHFDHPVSDERMHIQIPCPF